MRVKRTYNDNILIIMDHVPVKKGLIYIPNAKRRKLPTGKVEMLPEGYSGDVRIGQRYLFDNQKTFRVDNDRVLTQEDNLQLMVDNV